MHRAPHLTHLIQSSHLHNPRIPEPSSRHPQFNIFPLLEKCPESPFSSSSILQFSVFFLPQCSRGPFSSSSVLQFYVFFLPQCSSSQFSSVPMLQRSVLLNGDLFPSSLVLPSTAVLIQSLIHQKAVSFLQYFKRNMSLLYTVLYSVHMYCGLYSATVISFFCPPILQYLPVTSEVAGCFPHPFCSSGPLSYVS